jgi:hypothetical protein
MFFDLERDFEESLSSSGQIALANYARRDDSKTIQMLDVVQVVRPADLHSVQDRAGIRGFYSVGNLPSARVSGCPAFIIGAPLAGVCAPGSPHIKR